jgi:hypothetical protein
LVGNRFKKMLLYQINIRQDLFTRTNRVGPDLRVPQLGPCLLDMPDRRSVAGAAAAGHGVDGDGVR